MITFVKNNKNIVIYSLVFLLAIPFIGFNFLISFLSNILLLIFLVPLFLILIIFVGFNFFKSKIKACDTCGTISLNSGNNCINCGAPLKNEDENKNEKPSQTTIEIKAEEIK